MESSPVIVLPEDQIIHIRRSELHHYFFKWGRDGKSGAIALGYGSLFNHSYHPNARFELNLDKQTIDFYALQSIDPGEEITINYNGDPQDRSKLWFHPVE